MTDPITTHELEELSSQQGQWCISIYLPTHPTWPMNKPDVIVFENLIHEAQERLEQLALRSAAARDMLAPLRDMAADQMFWREQSDGLAVFLGPNFFRHYRLSRSVDVTLMVADHFAIKPLLPLLVEDSRFFVLAVTQHDVRLIRCTRMTATEVPLPPHPHSVSEATGFDEPERGFTFHTGTTVGAVKHPVATVHTSGVSAHDRKRDILEYCQQIDRRIHPVLQGKSAPLVLAGVEFVLSIYREANTYPHLLADNVPGATQRLSADELRTMAWPLVECEIQRARERDINRYHEAVGTGSASSDLREVLRAAWDGRVAVLFIRPDVRVWGHCNLDAREITMRDEGGPMEPDDVDLVDTAAAHTMRHGGNVWPVDDEQIPGSRSSGSAVAGIFRY